MDLIGDHSVHEPHVIRRPLSHCPACGSTELEPVVEIDAEEVHFLCGNCHRCWHVELGYVHRVHPNACHGCVDPTRCREVFATDHAG